MKFGMNLLLWSGDPDESLLPVIESLKEMGFDGVEIPLFNLDVDKWGKYGEKLKDLGLACTAVTVRNEGDNPISPDAKIRAEGVRLTKQTLDCCQALGAETLVGPYHSAIGIFSGNGPTADEWKWGVDSMRQVAEYAGEVNVMLGVEALNRFETYLLNTHADSARFAREVNHPNCKVMYDTFHSNIEEKDIAQAIRDCSDVLHHVHISENDRSTPGQGHIHWDTNFDALKEVGYDGWMVIEAFGLALPEIAAATKIWRKMFSTELDLAKEGLAFMKGEVTKRWG
ncbi:sugar phosphate isomerase/epimerase [Blastopirellula sp. JC732]|uniref:Sugar phosphate isomerase/epimerase n=1 Tax=Blastopirellula sediminis TaxID=2894196 RepID=A0A9X1ML93_9BACT|nr:sugar phosphate isomerase/epimerase [Blastopirellula sediminis]MCC9607464.1 sugar phosphate isomerase/epimerase [Blastopirellula sediminis]MCC9629243.1 sugar phosphate isomerase/epimerase [Blastopirellula sediminis]